MPPKGDITHFVANPASSWLALVYSTGYVQLVACEEVALLVQPAHKLDGVVSAVSFSPKGNHLIVATAGSDRVHVHDVQNAFRKVGLFTAPGPVAHIASVPSAAGSYTVYVTSHPGEQSSALTTVVLPFLFSKEHRVPGATPFITLNEAKIQRTAHILTHRVSAIVPSKAAKHAVAVSFDDHTLSDLTIADARLDVVQTHTILPIGLSCIALFYL